MRSGSPAQDDGGWPSPQRPHSDGAMGNPARFGSGARSEPQDVRGAGRREVSFGPEVSWPYGFRPLDSESREVLESAYGTGPTGSVYQPSAMDDYGDPGYSDPSYDGPSYPGGSAYSGGSGGSRGFGGGGRRSPGGVPGYHVPDAPRVPDPPRSGYQPSGYQAQL